MWGEHINPKLIAEEESFLNLSLKIGQIGCVGRFVMILVSNSVTFYFYLSEDAFSFIAYGLIMSILSPISLGMSILVTIGYYALLRSNMSRLALPYVFISQVAPMISWSFLFYLGFEYIGIYQVLTTVKSTAFTLVLTWIIWTINDTVSDRNLLKNIVFLTFANLFYNLLIVYLVPILVPIDSMFSYILLGVPSIFISLVQVVLVARLFGQDQVVVIDDEIGQTASSEWL
ncbi:MAG: hypothetical protein ACFFCT_10300 [Candidatus Odinarchaeota archaeon]